MKDNIIESYLPDDEMTKFGFISHMEDYIKQLLQNPKTAKVDNYLLSHGIDSPKALELLLKRTDPSDAMSAILIRNEKIKPEKLSDEDITKGICPKDRFHVKYSLPRKDYMKKMRNLYINLFENYIVNNNKLNEENANDLPSKVKIKKDDNKINFSFGKNGQGLSNELTKIGKEVEKLSKDNNVYIEKAQIDAIDDVYDLTVCVNPIKEGISISINEDGEGGEMGGATTCDASSGQFITPLNTKKPIKRTIYLTKEQYDYLKEAVEMDTAFGDFGYDAPGLEKKKDPAYDHKNMLKKSWRGGNNEK